jgi:hypothetical protein
MPVQRLIPLNNNAGAYTDILATIPCSRIVFVEDDAAARTGIQVKSLLDNFATNNVYSATAEPVSIPDIAVGYDHMRKLLGTPVSFSPGSAATKLLSVRGNGAGATTLRITEYE